MDRKKIFTELFENINLFGRAMLNKDHGAMPKGMPTRAQLGVMFLLSHRGLQSIKQVAEKFQISSSAATQLVDNLVREGLLTRKEDKNDRRKISVGLTAKGKNKMKMAEKMRFEKLEEIFELLTDEELLQLKSIYSKITNSLKIN